MSNLPTTSSSVHRTTDIAAIEVKEEPSPEAIAKTVITEFKRSGEFDILRKQTLRQWEESAEGQAFRTKLRTIFDTEVARDSSLLARDRGKAATLLSGTVERTQLYPEARFSASKNIFQNEEFTLRIYESLKRFVPGAQTEQGDKTRNDKTSSAQEAAEEFIRQGQGS